MADRRGAPRDPPGGGQGPGEGGGGGSRPAAGRGRPRTGGGNRRAGGDYHHRVGFVLQHPRTVEIHAERQRGDRRRGRTDAASGTVPPGNLLPLHQRRRGRPAHPRRRETALRRLRCPGPGVRLHPDSRHGTGRRDCRHRLCDPPLAGERVPVHADLLYQRTVHQIPTADGGAGGGVPEPADEREVPRLCTVPDHARRPGGCERPPRQDTGEVRPGAGRV